MEERALALAARQALLQQTAKQPGTAAVLWLTCAHLAAYNTLPSQIIHRQVALTAPNTLLSQVIHRQDALIPLEPWVIHKHCALVVVVPQVRHKQLAAISVAFYTMHGKVAGRL